jgi:DNA-binding Lrp family transcriptional regulator
MRTSVAERWTDIRPGYAWRRMAFWREGMAMSKAYVLIGTDPSKTKVIVTQLREIPGIREVNEVIGPYDVVAEVDIREMSDMTTILRQKIRSIEGVKSTVTCVAMP